jgi:hypothetical protein
MQYVAVVAAAVFVVVVAAAEESEVAAVAFGVAVGGFFVQGVALASVVWMLMLLLLW